MAKSRYKVSGTKDYLVAAVVCAFICLWSIRDAWFPTKKVLERHPLEFAVSADVPGVVKSVPVEVGQEIRGETVLVTLHEKAYREAVATAEKAFEEAKAAKSDSVQDALDALLVARENLEKCVVKNTDILRTTSHGEESLRGIVLEILKPAATHVEAGETVLLIEPHDTFYLFNQTLAVLMFLGTIVSVFFHLKASR